MFDIGFLELLICAVIALLILGPERLPTAARAAGRWVGSARRMVSQFTSELDKQLKADELKKELKKAGDVGVGDVEKSVRTALDEAKKYENMILPDDQVRKPAPAPASRKSSEEPDPGERTVETATAEAPEPPPRDRQTDTDTRAGSSRPQERSSESRS